MHDDENSTPKIYGDPHPDPGILLNTDPIRILFQTKINYDKYVKKNKLFKIKNRETIHLKPPTKDVQTLQT
jgi:hypothetical protein